jgi:hypothetical protein
MTFPWPTPAPGVLEPQGGESDPVQSKSVIEWFVNHWAPGVQIGQDTPLGAMLEVAKHIERGGEPLLVSGDDVVQASLQTAVSLRLLDWSIRALHGRAGRLEEVHQSFITKELLGTDNLQAQWGMPRGVGTLKLAAHLVQASGGSMVINGEGTAGHDLRWSPAAGGLALIERKDRAWSAGAKEPVSKRALYVARKIRDAGARFPRRRSGARVLAVGFPGFVPAADAASIRDEVNDFLYESLSRDPDLGPLPDFVLVEFIGAVDADERVQTHHFTSGLDLGLDRPDWVTVASAFMRAFTTDGPLLYPDPWPIVRG